MHRPISIAQIVHFMRDDRSLTSTDLVIRLDAEYSDFIEETTHFDVISESLKRALQIRAKRFYNLRIT
jgi:hypothetical protein